MQILRKSNGNKLDRIIPELPQHHIGEAECMQIPRKCNRNKREWIIPELPQHHIMERQNVCNYVGNPMEIGATG